MDDRTANALKFVVTITFIGTWIALGTYGLVTSRRMSGAEKRRRRPRQMALVGSLFVFFTTTLFVLESRSWSSLSILGVVVPAVVLIFYLGNKFTKLCDKCGAEQYNPDWFTPQRFCSQCGAEFDIAKPPHDDNLLE